MNRYKQKLTIIGCISTILLLILDGKTAIRGATEGIELCINSVIPSLLPFITFTYLLNNMLSQLSWKPISPFIRFVGIPEGSESLLFLGLLGGYPIGAQAVAEAYKSNRITKAQGRRLLAFCNNAGPAFIFGISPFLFSSKLTPWLLWGIHILSCIIVSLTLHKGISQSRNFHVPNNITFPIALKRSLHAVSVISGWVILFRTFQEIFIKHLDTLLPDMLKIIILGSAELTNGFYVLLSLENESLRFILASVFLGFGGFCVMMQTASVTEGLGLGLYFPGKLAQSSISYFLALFISQCLFRNAYISMPLTLIFGCILISALAFLRKNSRFIYINAV